MRAQNGAKPLKHLAHIGTELATRTAERSVVCRPNVLCGWLPRCKG